MAEADQQTAHCDEAAAPFESSADAVCYLFREHNRVLVGYLTARLRSEQDAKEVAQEALRWLTRAPTEFTFDRETTMAPTSKSIIHRIAVAAFVVSLAWLATARAANTTHAGGAGAAVKTSAAQSSQPDPNVKANASPEFPDVTVMTPRPPTDQELAGDSLSQFIVHHGTVHYVGTSVSGGLARWRGGRSETICPRTLGLDPAYNAFVTARLRAMAANVGAPVQADLECKDNVRIVFTTEPQKLMAEVLKWGAGSLGVRYPHQMTKQLTLSSRHTIQGWYITSGGGGGTLNADVGLRGPFDLLAVWPLVIETGLHGGGGRYGGIVSVILVIDTTKVAGSTIGSIADYVSMLALTVVQSPDHCDPLPSILDLMSSSCGTGEKPTAVTAGDLAFLKALYYHNTGWGPTLSRDDIQYNMMHQFKNQ